MDKFTLIEAATLIRDESELQMASGDMAMSMQGRKFFSLASAVLVILDSISFSSDDAARLDALSAKVDALATAVATPADDPRVDALDAKLSALLAAPAVTATALVTAPETAA